MVDSSLTGVFHLTRPKIFREDCGFRCYYGLWEVLRCIGRDLSHGRSVAFPRRHLTYLDHPSYHTHFPAVFTSSCLSACTCWFVNQQAMDVYRRIGFGSTLCFSPVSHVRTEQRTCCQTDRPTQWACAAVCHTVSFAKSCSFCEHRWATQWRVNMSRAAVAVVDFWEWVFTWSSVNPSTCWHVNQPSVSSPSAVQPDSCWGLYNKSGHWIVCSRLISVWSSRCKKWNMNMRSQDHLVQDCPTHFSSSATYSLIWSQVDR